jgi:AcrR family transcriptional regulator
VIQAGRTAKGEPTMAAIFEAALDLFRAQGYDATTMRAIARRAGVSLGSYHYFPSKEHLVLEFYRYLHSLHREAVAPVLARERGWCLVSAASSARSS